MYTLNDDIIKNSLLPTLDCIFRSKGRRLNYIRELLERYPSKSEDVLCVHGRHSCKDIAMNMDIPFMNGINRNIYSVNNRQNIEQFSNKVQIIVGAIVHDDHNVLYLEALNQKTIYRDHNYTMVLGHVSIDDEFSELYTPFEYFRISLARELSEELYHHTEQDSMFEYYLTSPDIECIGIFTSNEIPVSEKHIVVAYDVKVPNVRMFTSNEPEKHIKHTIPINQIHTIYDRLDGFFLKLISHIDIFSSEYIKFMMYEKYHDGVIERK